MDLLVLDSAMAYREMHIVIWSKDSDVVVEVNTLTGKN